MADFSIENQYQLYLQRVKLSEADMHPEQRHQLRQAFYGSAGQMLVLLRDDLPELPKDKAVKQYVKMIDEVNNYFQGLIAKQN